MLKFIFTVLSSDDPVSPETPYSECDMASDHSCRCCKYCMEEYVIISH